MISAWDSFKNSLAATNEDEEEKKRKRGITSDDSLSAWQKYKAEINGGEIFEPNKKMLKQIAKETKGSYTDDDSWKQSGMVWGDRSLAAKGIEIPDLPRHEPTIPFSQIERQYRDQANAPKYVNIQAGAANLGDVPGQVMTPESMAAGRVKGIENNFKNGKLVSAEDEAFYSQYMIDQLDKDSKAIIEDYKKNYSSRNTNQLNTMGAALTNAQNPFNNYGSQFASKTMSDQQSLSDLGKQLKALHPDWSDQMVRNYLGYAERVTDKEDTDKWVSDFSINPEDSGITKAAKSLGNFAVNRVINGGGSVVSAPESVTNMASGAAKAIGKYTGNENIYNWGEKASKVFDPNRPENFGQNTNSVYSRFNNLSQGTDQSTAQAWGNANLGILDKASQFATGQNAGELAYNLASMGADSAIMMAKGQAAAEMFGFGGATQRLEDAKKMGTEITKDMKKAAQAEKFLRNLPMLNYVESGYNSTYQQMKESGNMTEESAQTVGLIGGVAEFVTEQIGLETIFDLVDNPALNKKQFVKGLKAVLAEGSEEGMSDILTDIAQLVTDKLDPNSDSEFATMIKNNEKEYRQNGMDRKEAHSKAVWDAIKSGAKDIIQDSIVGALSAVGNVTMAGIKGNKQARVIDNVNNSIKSKYSNIDSTGDTAYDNSLRDDKARYESNPVQYIADNVNDSSDYGKEVKAEVQKIADKVAEGKELTKSDKVYLYENINDGLLDQVFGKNSIDVDKMDSIVPNEFKSPITNISSEEAEDRMLQAATDGNLDALSEAYNLAKNSRSAETRNRADEILNSPLVKGQLESKGVSSEEITNALMSQEEAYRAGYEEREVGELTDKNKIAYNEGKIKRAEEVRVSVGVDSERAQEKLSGLNESDQAIYRSGMKEDTNANLYNSAWDRFYNAGETDLSFENELKNGTNKYLESVLGKDTLKSFYEAGVQSRQRQLQKEAAEGLNKALGIKKQLGEFLDARNNKNDNVDYEAYRALASFTGQNIVLANFDSGNFMEGENAHFDPKNSTIYINADASSASGFHEVLGEFTEFYNAEGFEVLRKSLNQVASSVLGATEYNKILNKYKNAYGNANQSNSGIEMSREMTNDMLVAMMGTKKGRDTLAKMLSQNTDTKTAEGIVAKVKSLFHKIADSIRSIMDNSQLSSFQRDMLDKGAKELEANVDLFAKEFNKAVENARKVQENAQASESNAQDNQYSINPEFEKKNNYIRNNKKINKSSQYINNDEFVEVAHDIFNQVEEAKRNDESLDFEGIAFSYNHVFLFSNYGENIFDYDIIEVRDADSVFANINEVNGYEAYRKSKTTGRIYDFFRSHEGVYRKALNILGRNRSGGNNDISNGKRDSNRERNIKGSERNQTKKSYSINVDSDYMEAAKKGDVKEAQKLVDERAKEVFPNSKLLQDGVFHKMWHHTNSNFDSFLPANSKGPGGIKGIFFTPHEYGAVSSVGRDIHKQYYLNVENIKFATSVKEDRPFIEDLKNRQEGVTDVKELERINREFREETGIDAIFDWQNGWYTVLDPSLIKSADPIVYDDNGDIIPLSERFNTEKSDTRYSIDVDSQGNNLTEGQVEYFKDSKVRDKNGNLKPVYHGTGRADRVGFVFDPERATSGPMAYFTDNEGIAENYSRDKADTSISRDERYDSYYTQFRLNIGGKDMSIGEAWDNLPASKRAEIRQKAGHITFDDDYENIIYDENRTNGLGNFDQYKLREQKNNYLNALVSAWLEDGDLYGREADFLDVLKLVGIDNAEYLDPDYRDEKVYKVYMNLTNPFSTGTSYNEEFLDGLMKWWNNTDQTKYMSEDFAADMWDKTSMSVDQWMDRAREDLREGTTHAWTVVPDAVTDYLKSQGYDGIEDLGGKRGGEEHTVYIPFYSNQVKNTDNLNPTENKDIRYSIDVDEIDFFSMTEDDIDNILEDVGFTAYYKNLKFDKQVTPETLRQIANNLRKQYSSTYNLATFTDNLQKFFDYANENEHVSYEDFNEIMSAIARPFVQNISTKANPEEYKRFVDTLKSYGSIKLTRTQAQEVAHIFGSVKGFRSMMMPITNISVNKSDAKGLDTIWDELCDQFGDLKRDANEGEMPGLLYDELQALRAPATPYGGSEEEVVKEVAMRILEEYLGGEQGRKIAERNKAYKEKIRKNYEDRLQKFKDDTKARNKRAAEKALKQEQVKKYKQNIYKNARDLHNWASKPTKEKHIPKDMVEPIMEFLTALDFVEPSITQAEDGTFYTRVYVFDGIDEDGKRHFHFETLQSKSRTELVRMYNQKLDDINSGFGSRAARSWKDRMRSMKDMYDAIEKSDQFDNTPMAEFVQRLSPELATRLDDLLKKNVKGINNLDKDDIKTIDDVLRNIITAVNQGNKAYSSEKVDIASTADEMIKQSNEVKQRKSLPGVVEKVKDMLDIDQLTPRTAFSLLGEKGDQLYKLLREGFNTKIADTKKASDFMEQLKKDLGLTDKEIAKWGGKKALIKEFNLKDGVVRMTDLQIMALYETFKQPGMYDRAKGGIKIKPIERKAGMKIKQDKRYHVTKADVEAMVNTLTDKQKQFADELQKYMAVECAKAGNETTMQMYGYEMFINPAYFPLEVDKQTVDANDKNLDVAKLTGIRNSGFTKNRQDAATNPLMIGDILDIFTNHVAQMADYHGYAASTTDILRWFNYKQVVNNDSKVNYSTVKDALNVLLRSDRGADYFKQLLLDINGSRDGNRVADFIDYFSGAFKASSVLANASVVIQQPFAYGRAANMIDPKYLLSVNPVKAIKNIEKVNEYSPIAWWKAQGYYETSIGRSLKEIITGQGSLRDQINEKAGWAAGKADDITWAMLYQAVENEQRDKLKGQNLSKEEFRKRVNERFDDMIDQTQVVDSTLHRSQYMRSQRDLHKLQTAFMAEPTKSYNMLAEAILKDVRSGDKNFKRTGRAVASWAIASIMTAAAKSLVGAMRHTKDDDEYLEVYGDEVKANIIDNLDPLQMIPWVKDIEGAFKTFLSGENSFGSGNARYDLDAITDLIDTLPKIQKYINGESKLTEYGLFMAIANPLSKFLGVPVYALFRDVTAVYNLFFDDIKTSIESPNSKVTKLLEDVEKGKDESKIEQDIANALEAGKSVKDIRSKIKSNYNDVMEGEDEDAKVGILDMTKSLLLNTGMTLEEANEEIKSWDDESNKDYTDLDKLIKANDDGIEKEVNALLNEFDKKPDKVIDHIMDGFESTVEYEKNHDTATNYEDAVTRALQVLDPSYTYESVHAQRKALAEGKKNLSKAIDERATPSEIQKATKAYLDAGKEPSDIKDALTTEYKKQYIKLVEDKKLSEATELAKSIARAKAECDKVTKPNIADKYNGDYFQYEMNNITNKWLTEEQEAKKEKEKSKK